MVRYHIIFEGRVQGVGFRYQAKTLADQKKITGSIKNLSNGDVEVFIQTDKSTAKKFISELQNLRFVRVDSANIEEISQLVDEKDFKILY